MAVGTTGWNKLKRAFAEWLYAIADNIERRIEIIEYRDKLIVEKERLMKEMIEEATMKAEHD